MQIELTAKAAKSVEELSKVRANLAALEKREKVLKKELFEIAKHQPCNLEYRSKLMAVINQGIWKGYDQDRLVKDFPKAAAACAVSKPYLKIETAA